MNKIFKLVLSAFVIRYQSFRIPFPEFSWNSERRMIDVKLILIAERAA